MNSFETQSFGNVWSAVKNSRNHRELFLGIDIGSSGVKGLIFDVEVGIIATSTVAVDLYSDNPDFAEADPTQWRDAFKEIISKFSNMDLIEVGDIKAIAISGMVPAIVLLDAEKRPLRRAILQNDTRSFREIVELREKLPNLDFLGLTGSDLTQQSVAPKILWISRHEPEVLKKTKYVVGSYDWLAIELGAPPHIEINWAIESGIYNWDGTPLSEVIDATQIIWPDLLQPRSPGTVLGTISQTAAREFGLPEDLIIVVGGADHVLSAYGAGLVNHGDTLLKLGGSGDILVATDHKILDKRLYLDLHPKPGIWLPNGCMATSGSLLRWEEKLLGNSSFKDLDEEAAKSEIGNLITLPYFLGEKSPHNDPDLRGVIAGLNLSTTRGDIHRSLLEGIAYGFREMSEVYKEHGVPLQDIRVTNGGSKSRLWRQILSDVLQRELHSLTDHPGASFAAAVIAAIGIGSISDWSFMEGFLKPKEVISPDPANKNIYEERFHQFLQLKLSTQDLTHSLARHPRRMSVN